VSVAATTPGVFLRPALHVLPSGRSAEWTDAQTEQPSNSKGHDQAPPAEGRIDTCDAKSYPFPVWSGLLTRKHWARIGNTLWVFLWLLDRTTLERDGWGIVLGGRPVRDEEIATCFGFHRNKTANHRRTLLRSRYIEATRTPYGFVYRVRNSRKFGIWGKKRSTEIDDSLPRDPPKPVTPDPPKPVETKKTMQLDHPVEAEETAAANPSIEPWKAIHVEMPIGNQDFQKSWKFFFAHRNGTPLSETMERCIQAWQQKRHKVPPPFFEAKRQVEASEKQAARNGSTRQIPTVADIRPKDR
jgi:hypothetical protein